MLNEISINEISIYEDENSNEIYKFGLTYDQYCDLIDKGYNDELFRFFYRECLERHNLAYEYFSSIRKRYNDVSNEEFCDFIDAEMWEKDIDQNIKSYIDEKILE